MIRDYRIGQTTILLVTLDQIVRNGYRLRLWKNVDGFYRVKMANNEGGIIADQRYNVDQLTDAANHFNELAESHAMFAPCAYGSY